MKQYHSYRDNTTEAATFFLEQLHESDTDNLQARATKEQPCHAMCRSSRSCLVLARIEATPPQRLITRIDWTPACRSQNNLSNHMSARPRPAITPSSSFTSSVHLQPAARNTYQPPNLHMVQHVASCYTLNSSGTFLSGDGNLGLQRIQIDIGD
jgi:hypothetical protein